VDEGKDRAVTELQERRWWVSWLIGLGLLAAGFLVGWASQYLLPEEFQWEPAPTPPPAQPVPKVDQARVTLHPLYLAGVGEPVDLRWTVRNTGTTTWTPHQYRFEPVEGAGPVLPVRAPVIREYDPKTRRHKLVPLPAAPGIDLEVAVTVIAPAEPGLTRYAWQLVGPDGPVAGGELTATVPVAR
jgi:hypothetical protein